MGIKELKEWDRSTFEKLRKFQLSNTYQRIGLLVFIVTFLSLIAFKFIENEPLWLKNTIQSIMLFGLLIISVSKEKIEDELVVQLRQQSYQLAFVLGVFYSLIQPLVNYIVDFILNEETTPFEMGYIKVLFFMLLIQIFFFRMLLKKCR